MTKGIVGYGHIGSQLSVLAEAMGMNVMFFDILQIMPLGCATPRDTLEDVLRDADFVTLHVPGTQDTREMIGYNELSVMKKGSYLINASRGNVVRINCNFMIVGCYSGAGGGANERSFGWCSHRRVSPRTGVECRRVCVGFAWVSQHAPFAAHWRIDGGSSIGHWR